MATTRRYDADIDGTQVAFAVVSVVVVCSRTSVVESRLHIAYVGIVVRITFSV